jgi:hypothetical protein
MVARIFSKAELNVQGFVIATTFIVRLIAAPGWDGTPGDIPAWLILFASFGAACVSFMGVHGGVSGIASSAWSLMILLLSTAVQRSAFWGEICIRHFGNSELVGVGRMKAFLLQYFLMFMLTIICIPMFEMLLLFGFSYTEDLLMLDMILGLLSFFDMVVCCAHLLAAPA